jgi:rRNA maturation endonuclease Nob1
MAVTDFERATGVVEHLRQCMAIGCKKFFRATSEETICPHCGADLSRDTRESAGLATAGARGPSHMTTR